jgi:hypothetical protein
MQFCDVAGFASQWCARKSVSDPAWLFDARYWSTQGPAAWPAILTVAEAPGDRSDRVLAREFAARLQNNERATKTDWRSCQWREAKNRAALLATTK